MQISNISTGYLSKLNNIFNSKPVNFKGNNLKSDRFELSYEAKLEKYKRQCEINPNTAFMYNPDLSYEQKLEELKLHPEIEKAGDVAKGLGFDITAIKDDIFDFDTLEKPIKSKGKTSTLRMRYVDCSSLKNKETLERLEAKKGDLADYSTFIRLNSLSKDEFNKYLKIGRLERYDVYPESPKSARQSKSQIIDLTNPKNIRGIEIHEALNARSKYLDKLLSAQRNEKVYADVNELYAYGFGDAEELAKLIDNNVIDGIIESRDEDGELSAKVNLNDNRTKQVLTKLRNSHCVKADIFSKKYNIPISELEEAYFDNKIDFYPTAIFPTDWGNQYISIKSQKNIDYLNQKLLEREISEDLSKKTSKANSLSSLRMKIAWQLSPNTRNVASELAQENHLIGAIIHKKDVIEEQTIEAESKSKISDDEAEEEIEKLNDFEETALKQYYKNMWQIAGTEEYTTALKEAKKIIETYKKDGIDSIQDTAIRQIIIDYIENAN